jgi:hypothetical protein
LETRCTVHRLAFERLIERVGAEAAPATSTVAWGSGVATTTISNTTINSAQGGAAQASATSDAAATSTSGPQQQGPLSMLFIALMAVGGGVVRVVVAMVTLVGGLLARLLALGAVLRAVRAVSQGSSSNSAGGTSASATADREVAQRLQPALAATMAVPFPVVAAAPQAPSLPVPASTASVADSSSRTGGTGGNGGNGGKPGPGAALPFDLPAIPNPFQRKRPPLPAAADSAAPVFTKSVAYFEALRSSAQPGPSPHTLPRALRAKSGSDSEDEVGW